MNNNLYLICGIIIIFNFIFFLNIEKISKIIKIYDHPDKLRKFHKKKTALLGGFIIFSNFVIFQLVSYLNIFDHNNDYSLNIFFIIIISAFFIFGIIDDKYKLSANYKLIIYLILIYFFLKFDPTTNLTSIKFSFLESAIQLKKYSIPFTILCFLLFMNAFNMLDGINLQSGSYALLTFVYLFLIDPDYKIYFIFLISLIFFLSLNFLNKIFLGESGTNILSFFIGYSFIQNYKLENLKYADQIFLIMLIPGLELLRLAITRIFKKKHPFSSDRNHLHHYLLKKYQFQKTFLIIFSLNFSAILLSWSKVYHYIFIIIISAIYLLLVYKVRK